MEMISVEYIQIILTNDYKPGPARDYEAMNTALRGQERIIKRVDPRGKLTVFDIMNGWVGGKL